MKTVISSPATNATARTIATAIQGVDAERETLLRAREELVHAYDRVNRQPAAVQQKPARQASAHTVAAAAPVKKGMTAAGRDRIAAAQKKRWADAKRQKSMTAGG